MKKRHGGDDEDGDMLVIGSGLGGKVAALQLTTKRFRGRPSDDGIPESMWKIKRFAWAPLEIKGARRIHWLPRVMVYVVPATYWSNIVAVQRAMTERLKHCRRVLLTKHRRPLLPATARQKYGTGQSLAGLSWDEFVQHVALIEAEAARRPGWYASVPRK